MVLRTDNDSPVTSQPRNDRQQTIETAPHDEPSPVQREEQRTGPTTGGILRGPNDRHGKTPSQTRIMRCFPRVTLEFSYMPQGLYTGALLTGGAVLLLVLIYLLSKTLEKRKKRGKGRIS